MPAVAEINKNPRYIALFVTSAHDFGVGNFYWSLVVVDVVVKLLAGCEDIVETLCTSLALSREDKGRNEVRSLKPEA